MMVSLMGAATSQIGLGVYFVNLPHHHHRSSHNTSSTSINDDGVVEDSDGSPDWSWTPLPLLMIFTIAYNVGLGSLTGVIATEILPVKSRTCTLTIANVTSNLSWFIVTKTFKMLQDSCGVSSPFFLYGSVCILGFIFIFIFLPETRDKKCKEATSSSLHD